MASAAEIVRQLLIDGGLGAESGNLWVIYVGFLPDEIDNAICVYDTAGTLDGRIMSTGEQIEHFGIQIRVRGISYPDTRKKIEDVALFIAAQIRTLVTIDSNDVYLVHNISQRGGILSIGVELTDRKRHNFTVNAITTIKKKD